MMTTEPEGYTQHTNKVEWVMSLGKEDPSCGVFSAGVSDENEGSHHRGKVDPSKRCDAAFVRRPAGLLHLMWLRSLSFFLRCHDRAHRHAAAARHAVWVGPPLAVGPPLRGLLARKLSSVCKKGVVGRREGWPVWVWVFRVWGSVPVVAARESFIR